jgi:RNA polymerase sigma-70 factor (ECF subfamily)
LDYTQTLQLIIRSREGDAFAVEELVRAYEARVYRLALSILDDPAEADEAAQDAFIAAIDRLSTFRGESSFTTWLLAITINVCRGRLRKRRARVRLTNILHTLFQHQANPPQPENEVIQNEADRALWGAVRALDDKQREVIVLRYFHEMRQDDIAAVLGVTDRTVRNRLHNAHERLREVLKGHLDQP